MLFFSYGTSNSCGVLVAYLGKISFALNNQKTDKAGRIMILDVMLDGGHFIIIINLYNANTETELCKTINELQSLLNFFGINQNKRITFAGDFNILFSSKLEARGGKAIPKRKSIIKFVDIKETLDICDIW